MGKFTQGMSNAGLRTGNTIATPLRISGELVNAVGNIPRQGMSATKNIAEVTKQTRDALLHNFTNFSKVDGKWYQKMLKVPLNLVSAVSRRPAMIVGSGVVSGLNQGVREPFKKLLYTPGKMFKGMRNATRIFSKKKGFDFATYDTHETKGDTWVNQIKEKSFGFLGVKGGSTKPAETKPIETKPAEVKKPEAKIETKPVEEKKEDENIKTIKIKSGDKETMIVTPGNGDKSKMVILQNDKETEKTLIQSGDKEILKVKSNDGKEEFIGVKEGKDKAVRKRSGDKEPMSASLGNNKNDQEKAKSIDDPKKNDKERSEKKDQNEQEKRFPERKNLDRREKANNEKEYTRMLDNTMTKEGIIERGKKEKKGDTLPEIVSTVKKENPTFAGYMEEEILNKAA